MLYTTGATSANSPRSWQVYEVAGSDTVAPLSYEPAVLTHAATTGPGWNKLSISWYQAASRWAVPLAASGPSSWPRVSAAADLTPPRIPVHPAVVTDIVNTDDSISFDVDPETVRTRSPVLVKTSYFPNWQAVGADGPWRVTPNLMVVIPTSTHVRLHYGFTPVDNAGRLASVAGLAAAGSIWWWDRRLERGRRSGCPGRARLGRRPRAGGRRSAGGTPPWGGNRPRTPCRVTWGRPVGGASRPKLAAVTRRPWGRPAATPTTSHPPAPGRPRLSVVVPAYGEADRIADTVTTLRRALAEPGGEGVEIVVVDDGSHDETAQRAQAAGADRVIRFPANRGKGAAVRAGMLAATGSAVVFTDADLSYPPAQIVRLRDAVEAGWDVVVGNRNHADTQTIVGSSTMRGITHQGFNQLTKLVLARRFGDTQCGLKGFHHASAQLIFGRSRIDGFAFDVEALGIAGRLGLSITEVPVQLANAAESTVHLKVEVLRMLRDLGRIRRWTRTGAYDRAEPADTPSGPTSHPEGTAAAPD